MEGRWKLWVAGLALCGLLGCSRWRTRQEVDGPRLSSSSISKPTENARVGDSKTKPETLVALAETWLRAGEDPNRSSRDRTNLLNQSRTAYMQVLEKQPKSMVAMAGLARTYAAMGDRDKALEIYGRCAEMYPNEPRLWYDLGVAQGRFRDWDSAAECFAEAARLDPENKQYRTVCGLTFARLGQTEEAFRWLEKGRNEAEARFLIAKMMRQIDRDDLCRQQLTMALRAQPMYEPAHQMLAQLSGDMHRAQGPSQYNVQPVEHETSTPMPVEYTPPVAPLEPEMPAPMPPSKPKVKHVVPEPPGTAKPAPKLPPLLADPVEEPMPPVDAGTSKKAPEPTPEMPGEHGDE
jgi:thioredoxin-like negative regulator of GroEL